MEANLEKNTKGAIMVFLGYADIIYISISIITFSLYNTFIKKTPGDKRLIVLFWMHIFAYISYIIFYFYKHIILMHDKNAIEHLIHEYTIINSPLYFLLGLCFVGTLIIYQNLLRHYPLSKVIPFAQISVLFTYIGQVFLGDVFDWSEFIGILIITFGAILTVCDTISFTHPLKPFKNIPPRLIKGVIGEAFLKASASVITFFLTQDTAINETIMNSLLHVFPFASYNPFEANLGARFFMIAILYYYLTHTNIFKNEIVRTLKENTFFIIATSIIYLISVYDYQLAYLLTPDKNILAALTKLNIPILMLFASILLKEKITVPKIVGAAIVILGGLIVLI